MASSSSLPANLITCEYSSLSVQELVKKPLLSIPQNYIREDHDGIHDHHVSQTQTHHDESDNTSSSSPAPIPIIDMSLFVSHDDDDQQHKAQFESELQKLHMACRDWGLFQVVNHGVNLKEMEELRKEVEGFFKLPLEEKMKYKIRAGDVEGYGTVIRSQDQKRDWNDRFYMTINPLHKIRPHLFPQLPSSLRSMLEVYIKKVQNMGMKILELVEKGLRMKEREMRDVFEDGMQALRMTYYPPCPHPDAVMGFGAHSDATGITILNQVNGVSGLQIKKDGIWLPVHLLPNALLVNVGDILEILSNGVYKSVEHRAIVNSNKERISLAVFFLPKFESQVGPAMSLLSPQNPPLFRRIAMETYVKEFFSHKQDGKSYLQHMRIKNEHVNVE